MPRFLLIGLSVFAFIFSAKAQQTERCATDIKLQEFFASDPDAIQRFWQNENQLQQIIASNSGGGRNIIITIPVVVHVVGNASVQAVSDAQIQSQINRLNLDFRKLNTDVTNVPSVWTSLVADYEIEFCLARRDPSGNNTTGIIRKVTTATFFHQ